MKKSILITGRGGSGKTTKAKEFANQFQNDEVIFISFLERIDQQTLYKILDKCTPKTKLVVFQELQDMSQVKDVFEFVVNPLAVHKSITTVYGINPKFVLVCQGEVEKEQTVRLGDSFHKQFDTIECKRDLLICEGLNKSAQIVYLNNKANGFWDKDRNVGELLMLVTSELGEAMEAHRKGRFANGHTMASSYATYEEWFKNHYKDTFEDEIADAVIRLLDLSAGLGIDLEKHINAKVQYNESRPRLHGKLY